MAYDYNIDTPNLFGNFVRGQEITEQRKQRALENQQIEQDRAQKEQDRTQQTVANFSRQWASAAPQAKPLLARVARQAISQNPALAEALGGQVPETDDPAEWDNFMGGGALLGEPEGFSNAGSGFLLGNQGTIREIPGFPKGGKAQIVKIGDGQGGYQQMVFEGGQLRPLTMAEQQEAQGAPQQPQMQQVNAPGMDDKVLAQANLMVQQGVPDAQIEAWMQEQLGGVPTPSGGPQEPAQPQAMPAPAPQPVARRSYADTPLDQVGGGTPAPPRFGYTPPKAAKTAAASGAKAPGGYRWAANGNLEPIPGGPADRSQKGGPNRAQAPVKLSEDERKSKGFYNRMVMAEGELERVVGNGFTPGNVRDTYTAGQGLKNAGATSQGQEYRQAQENWVRANLRAESGAVIGPEEMEREIANYFPQPFDGKDVIEQKKRFRAQLAQSMRDRAGAAIPSTSAPNETDALGVSPRLDGSKPDINALLDKYR